jgi:hypothetical protein
MKILIMFPGFLFLRAICGQGSIFHFFSVQVMPCCKVVGGILLFLEGIAAERVVLHASGATDGIGPNVNKVAV